MLITKRIITFTAIVVLSFSSFECTQKTNQGGGTGGKSGTTQDTGTINPDTTKRDTTMRDTATTDTTQKDTTQPTK